MHDARCASRSISSTRQPPSVSRLIPITTPNRTSSIVPGRSAGTRITTIFDILKPPRQNSAPARKTTAPHRPRITTI
jgi:hypothetical protein